MKDNLVSNFDFAAHRRRRQLIKLANYCIWMMVAVVVMIILNILALYPAAKNFYREAKEAKVDYQNLLNDISKNDSTAVDYRLKHLDTHLESSLTNLRQLKYSPIAWLPILKGKINDAENILVAGKLTEETIAMVWNSGQAYIKLINSDKQFDFTKLSAADKKSFLAAIESGKELFPKVNENINYIEESINRIGDPEFLWQYDVDVESFKRNLADFKKIVAAAEPLAQIMPTLAGYPRATNFLFVFQNNNELRPTGGFIGTYGLAITNNGELTKFQTHDVYHLDWPAKEKLKIEPPQPIKKYLGQDYWFMRDANWSPNWPDSAKKIVWFYNQEAAANSLPQEKFDLVIAITPKVVVDLLKIIGPITIRGQVYSSENFTTLLQENTEKNYAKLGLSEFDRKEIVGEIAKELEKKILTKAAEYWQAVSGILADNLASKDILIFSFDSELASFLQEKKWAGAQSDFKGDYLEVVDANLHALKTDAIINKNINYEVKETNDGLLAKVSINYSHLGDLDWKTDKYKTFTRIYIPLGSKLLKVIGFFGSDKDILSGIENGRQWFGAYTEVEPGKLGGLSFEYLLPYNLYEQLKVGKYSLNLDKQPGSRVSDLVVGLYFKEPIIKYNPTGLNVKKIGSSIVWQESLGGDKYYEVNF
ncbi:MAG: DUF4012 domain-containing protein [Patescibacteria group bacterium]|nr:DUF4012 domain-containing protein [Patescibacteria group bacterium]